MLYAILAYHVEAEVTSWTPQEDAAVMTGLLEVHDRLNAKKLLGPAARLGGTAEARTLRGPGDGMVIDGPFAETKEQLLGLYVVNCDNADAALDVRARPAPGQSFRRLRDPPDQAVSARRSLAGNGRRRRSGLRRRGTKANPLTQPVDGVRLSHRVLRELAVACRELSPAFAMSQRLIHACQRK